MNKMMMSMAQPNTVNTVVGDIQYESIFPTYLVHSFDISLGLGDSSVDPALGHVLQPECKSSSHVCV